MVLKIVTLLPHHSLDDLLVNQSVNPSLFSVWLKWDMLRLMNWILFCRHHGVVSVFSILAALIISKSPSATLSSMTDSSFIYLSRIS